VLFRRRYAKGANISVCNPFGEVVDPAAAQPKKGSCPRLQMHKLDTQFYLDLVTPTGNTITCDWQTQKAMIRSTGFMCCTYHLLLSYDVVKHHLDLATPTGAFCCVC
jgi:hypothetical protein